MHVMSCHPIFLPTALLASLPLHHTTGGRGVSLAFVNLEAEVKFGVTLALPTTYPAGPLVQQQAKIWFDGG